MGNINANNFWTVKPNFTKFCMLHQCYSRYNALCSKTVNSENKMAADAILDFHTNLNNSGSIHPIVIKSYYEHRISTPDMILGSKMKFYKIQDGRRRPTEIYKYCHNLKMFSPKWTKFGRSHLLGARNKKILPKFWIFKSKMAAGRHWIQR